LVVDGHQGEVMNRFARYSIYAAISLIMGLLILGGQRLVMMPTVYDSISQMGDRLGRVIPLGYSDEPRHRLIEHDQMVKLIEPTGVPTYIEVLTSGVTTQESLVTTEVLSTSPISPPSLSASMLGGIDLRVPAMVVVMYLAALFLVSMISLWKHSGDEFRTVRTGAFVSILSMGAVVSVALATLLWVARVFWTGVDQSVAARSVVQGIGNGTAVRYRSEQLLGMGAVELLLIVLAMVLTALPILVWIDLKLFRPIAGASQNRTPMPGSSLMSKVYEHKIVDRHFSQRSIKRMSKVCYTVVVVFLWMAPWSTTMLNAFWKH
jgi:hypothetical protein